MPPQNQTPASPLPTAERLQEIRDADAGLGEDLQFCPIAWTHRRELLALVDRTVADRENDALAVAALSGMLEPYSGGTSDLHELVARMHRARDIASAIVKEAVGPVAPCACCSNERRNMDGGCDSCGAPCL